MKNRFDEKTLSRFWKKVKKTDSCWLWTGASHPKGYGNFSCGGRSLYAHRFSFMLLNGREIGRRELVCHKCDTPACVNPDHLFLGSYVDNAKDMMAKGRGGQSKLDWLRVKAIRTLYKKNSHDFNSKNLGNIFGVHHSVILDVISNETWVA